MVWHRFYAKHLNNLHKITSLSEVNKESFLESHPSAECRCWTPGKTLKKLQIQGSLPQTADLECHTLPWRPDEG